MFSGSEYWSDLNLKATEIKNTISCKYLGVNVTHEECNTQDIASWIEQDYSPIEFWNIHTTKNTMFIKGIPTNKTSVLKIKAME